MKSLTAALSLAGLLGLAACGVSTSPITPNDTGNMAYPTPSPSGNIGYARPATLDTGSMNVPTASGGRLRPGYTGNDTGNMALPNRAQGNSLPSSVQQGATAKTY